VTYQYDYLGPTIHNIGKFFIGYGHVLRQSPLSSEYVEFLNEDRYSGVLLKTATQDALTAGMERFEARTYQDAVYQGIPWKRLETTENGYRTLSSPITTVSETASVVQYWNDYCPWQTQRTNSAGVLTTTNTYVIPPAFGLSMTCLTADVVETGRHNDTTLDFDYETSIERNEAGLPTAIRSLVPGAAGQDPWTLQEIVYHADGQVKRITSPGKGKTEVDCDPTTRLPYQVTSPDGSFSVVTSRDPLTDALLGVAHVHGSLAYQQSFRFDGQERLWKKWDDLTKLTSEDKPEVTLGYEYATAAQPGAVTQYRLIDAVKQSGATTVDLVTASGEAIVTAQRMPQGWAFGPMKSRSVNQARSWSYTKAAVGAAVAPEALDYAALQPGTQLVQDSVASILGYRDETTWYHQDVSRRVVTSVQIQGSLLMKVSQENGGYYTAQAMDSGGRVLGYWDEAGTFYQYRYDSLGRLRDVALPDGNHHRVYYDAYARVGRIEREGVVQGQGAVTIEYLYDPVSGLPKTKVTQSPDKKLSTTLTNSYDSIGRVKVEQYTDSQKGSRSYEYFYDGATPEQPSDKSKLGYLTAVKGDGYQKIIAPRADGLPIAKTTILSDWRTVESTFSYLEGGTPSEHSVQVKDAAGQVLSSSKYLDHYDDGTGRLTSTDLNGAAFAAYGYDPNNLLQGMVFGNGDWAMLSFDSRTWLRTGSTQSTAGWTGGATQRFNARGLVELEGLAIGNVSFARQYDYWGQRFLKSSKDPQNQYAYDYDSFGLPTRVKKNQDTARGLVRSGATLTAGTVTYKFDGLGRTIQKGDLTLTYGPDGQVAMATRGGSTWGFLYDEKGQRLVKFADGKPVAAYLDQGYLDADGLSEPVKFAGRTVGLVRNGRVQSIATDLRGTVLGEADGTARIASPFGDRDVHPGVAAAIDYVEKRWDPDLGLVRMGVRDYDAAVGLFLTADPRYLERPLGCLDKPLACNLYGYAGNDPILNVDPNGEDWKALLVAGRDFTAGVLVGVGEAFGADFQGSVPDSPEFAWGRVTGLVGGSAVMAAEGVGMITGGTAGTGVAVVGSGGIALVAAPVMVAASVTAGTALAAKAVSNAPKIKNALSQAMSKTGNASSTGKRPPNESPKGAGRRGAFNEAKRQNEIPTSQQPESTGPNMDKRDNVQPGRQYQFKNNNGEDVIIRDDAAGHVHTDDDTQSRGPHFNDPDGNHYDY
jgi:RHS repeat-associated protein